MAKGELARQTLNFKEAEAGKRRVVRGRQFLYLFDHHFKTNEEVGSLSSVEDLLKVNMLHDDLSTSFTIGRAWLPVCQASQIKGPSETFYFGKSGVRHG